MSERSSIARASLVGFAIGGAAGLVVGLLLAPDEGRQVRKRVAYLAERGVDHARGLFARLSNEPVASVARQTADAVVADARQQAEQLLSEAEALMSEARGRRRPDGGSSLRRAS